MKSNSVRERFVVQVAEKHLSECKVLTTAVKLPTGAIEVINNTEEISSKIDYLLSSYDTDFKLKSNPNVQIVGFMLV